MRNVFGKTLLTTLAAGLVVASLAFLHSRAELGRLREENRELSRELDQMASLKTEYEKLQHIQADAIEIERLRKQTQEIHKLRAQYQELQELRKQHTALQQQNQELKAANEQLTGQQQALRTQFQSVVTAAAAARTNTPAAPAAAAWLGVSIQSLGENASAESQNPGITEGVVVAAVIPDTPAETSGLRVGDIVTAIDGQPVNTAAQLRDVMATKQVGQRVVVDVFRGGLIHRIGVNAAPYPQR